MRKISLFAILIAFALEFVLDMFIQSVVLVAFAGGAFTSDMSDEAQRKVSDAIAAGGGFQAVMFVLGTATTIGGGYLTARIARRFPYYNGLGIGLLGLAFGLYFWSMNPLWINIVGALTVIPASIYGAHLAKRHLPPPGDMPMSD